MSSVKLWWNQLRQMWDGWTFPQRVGMSLAAALCAAMVAGVGLWSLQSQYVPLASDLTPTTAAELVSTLDSAGIASRLNFSGSAVLVPKQELNRARLAAGKLIDLSDNPSDDIEGSVWSDPTLYHVRIMRQKEQRLARSIMQFDYIKSATVHLSVPEPSPFLRDKATPSASVVVGLRTGGAVARQDAAAIVSLVAHSVEGLEPSRVTVMDTQGRILSAQESMQGDVAGQFEYRRRLESDLAAKAEALLSNMLGPGRAVVRVTADVDFTQTERQTTSYDPERKVKASETVKTESHTTPKVASSGAAGIASNVGGSATTSNVGTKIEENTTEYLNGETKDLVREAPGRVKRLTVAAAVQLPEGGADPALAAITPQAVEDLIKQAVGFDVSRDDEIKVVSGPLAGASLFAPEAPAVPWDRYEQMIRAASLGLAALVALVVGLLVLRRFRPTTVSAPAVESGGEDRLATLAMRARENPEAMAQALSAWLAASKGGDGPPSVPFRKAG
ncbi:MAG: flagellar M-ring protein FliF [Planctomyces sp.]|nr:flagellar M-ring protein FliF [Planctomyces sp.]